MIHQLYMPKFGANIESGTIVEWLKQEGEKITKGEIKHRIMWTIHNALLTDCNARIVVFPLLIFRT
mgnify:CR=1 FL=1